MALTGSKLIHANTPTPGNVPTAGNMQPGQIAINTADQLLFIKSNIGTVVPIASAAAVTKAMSAIQTINGISPTSGAVTLLPTQIGDFGVPTLDSSSKIPTAFLPDALLGSLDFISTWNASTNTPTLPDPTTVKGHYYVVAVAGTQFGHNYAIGDWAISDGVTWDILLNHNTITSVNGQTGTVVLTASDVNALSTSGGALTGALALGNNAITGVKAPVNPADAATKQYVDTAVSVGGGGSVSSVNVVSTEFSLLTATGGPITNSGNITLDFVPQAANQFFAGPVSGGNAVPTVRAIVSEDVANITLDDGTF